MFDLDLPFSRMHLGLFPYGQTMSVSIVKELKCRLVWVLTGTSNLPSVNISGRLPCNNKDKLTSLYSPYPLDATQLKQLTSVAENIESNAHTYSEKSLRKLADH